MKTNKRHITHKSIVHIILFAAILAAILAAGCTAGDAGQNRTYTVQAGDTLAKIAQANGTTVDEIVELNKGTYPSLKIDPGAIEIGWELELPGSKSVVKVTSKKTPSLGTGPTATVKLDRDAFEAEVVRLVNEERVKAGLASLKVDPGLMRFARERAEDMVKRGYFSHQDPETGQDLTPGMGENISRYSTSWNNENLARNLVSGLMNSEGHRANILHSQAHKIGVGVATGNGNIIITQVFAK